MHVHILFHIHENGMPWQQREMCFGCHFQRTEHHNNTSFFKKVSPNLQSATVSQWFEMIQLKLTYFNHRSGHLHHPEPLKFMDSFTVQKQWLVANCCYCEIHRGIQRNTFDVFTKYINIYRERMNEI